MRKPVQAAAPVALAAVSALALSACGADTARTLGFTRDAPDEFQVVTRAPLSLPPNLAGELPPPRPGAPRPQELTPREAAEGVLAPGALIAGRNAPARPTRGESALLSQAGGGRPLDPEVRRRVDEEASRLERPSRTVVDRMLFWQEPPPPGVALDPARESQRLRENAALGRPPTSGETPVVQPSRERPGLFGRLF